ncbi:MAG TPA: N-6 DNA methylase [Flavisolibacter sp.]|nr:N-6 DNA methylase [Flavisolibacter sp.]
MLNSTVKKRIDDLHDLLVGQLPLPSERLELITVSLIYKFMEDMDTRAKKLGGKQSFFVKSLSKYSWSTVLEYKPKGNENAAAKLVENFNNAIRAVAKAEHIPEFFRSIFNNVSLRMTNGKILKSFMDDISKFEYTHSEELGNAFEYLLKTFGNQKENGQFRTPRNIIHFIVNVVDPQKNDTILDPACGTGGFLIEAATHIKKTNTSPQYIDNPNKWGDLLKSWKGKLSENIQGYDNTPLMVRLSKVNMFLHQLTDPQIHEYDTISNYGRWNDKFDVILANPPFMTPKGGVKAHDKFKLQAKKAEVLFTDYILEHLKPGGRAGIIVPEGIIANSSNNDFVDLRKWALSEMGLWAVVSLPAKIFEPYSGVKTSILFIDRNLAKNRKDIILLKVENDGYALNKNRNEIKQNDLPEAEEILQLFKEGKSLSDKQWKVRFNITPKEDFEKLDAYRANTTAWNVCRKSWERLDKTVIDLNVKLLENKEKRSMYEEHFVKAVDNFKEDTGFQFKTPKIGNNELINPISKEELKELFASQIREEAIKFGNLEPIKKLSKTIVDALIDQRHYNLSFDRKDLIESSLFSQYEYVRVKDIVETQTGFPFAKEYFTDEKSDDAMPLLRIRDLKNNASETYYTGEYDEEFVVKNGDFLISMDGEFNIFHWQGGKALLNQRITRLHSFKNCVPEYLFFMIGKELKKIEDATPFVTVKHISHKQILNIEIPFPPIEKQEEIVVEFETYQKVVDGCENVIDNYAPALPPNDAWQLVRLEDVCKLVRGPFGSSMTKAIFVEKGFPVYEQMHAIRKDFKHFRYYVTDEKFKEMKRFAVYPNDVLMSYYGTIGKAAVVPEQSPTGVIHPNLLKLEPFVEKIRPMFLKLIIETPHFQAQLSKGAKGVAVQKVAPIEEIKGFEIPLPSLDEQDEILTDHYRELQTLKGVSELKAKMEAKIKELVNSLWGVPAEEGELVEA